MRIANSLLCLLPICFVLASGNAPARELTQTESRDVRVVIPVPKQFAADLEEARIRVRWLGADGQARGSWRLPFDTDPEWVTVYVGQGESPPAEVVVGAVARSTVGDSYGEWLAGLNTNDGVAFEVKSFLAQIEDYGWRPLGEPVTGKEFGRVARRVRASKKKLRAAHASLVRLWPKTAADPGERARLVDVAEQFANGAREAETVENVWNGLVEGLSSVHLERIEERFRAPIEELNVKGGGGSARLALIRGAETTEVARSTATAGRIQDLYYARSALRSAFPSGELRVEDDCHTSGPILDQHHQVELVPKRAPEQLGFRVRTRDGRWLGGDSCPVGPKLRSAIRIETADGVPLRPAAARGNTLEVSIGQGDRLQSVEGFRIPQGSVALESSCDGERGVQRIDLIPDRTLLVVLTPVHSTFFSFESGAGAREVYRSDLSWQDQLELLDQALQGQQARFAEVEVAVAYVSAAGRWSLNTVRRYLGGVACEQLPVDSYRQDHKNPVYSPQFFKQALEDVDPEAIETLVVAGPGFLSPGPIETNGAIRVAELLTEGLKDTSKQLVAYDRIGSARELQATLEEILEWKEKTE